MKSILTFALGRSAALPVWLLLLGAMSAAAVQPVEIQRRIESGEKITFVDVRSTEFFQKGHVPGALNIPSALIGDKRLPKLGKVVLYDDGLGGGEAEAVMPLMNQKPGIQAEVLEGGFAGWSASQGATTAAFGVSKEEIAMITYQKLKKASPDDLVLVDLRSAPTTSGAARKSGEPAAALTDLRSEFPGAPVTKSPFSVPATRKSATPGSGTGPLLVLVDNGDGTAEKTARALKANGITRFVILAGGEQAIVRQGQAGLQRLGQTVEAPAGASVSTNKNP